MSIHVVGQNGGEQSGGGSIRCRIIEDGSHTEHRLGLNRRLLVADGAAPGQAFGGRGGARLPAPRPAPPLRMTLAPLCVRHRDTRRFARTSCIDQVSDTSKSEDVCGTA